MKTELSFYDVKTKAKFPSSEWRIEVKEFEGQDALFRRHEGPGPAA